MEGTGKIVSEIRSFFLARFSVRLWAYMTTLLWLPQFGSFSKRGIIPRIYEYERETVHALPCERLRKSAEPYRLEPAWERGPKYGVQFLPTNPDRCRKTADLDRPPGAVPHNGGIAGILPTMYRGAEHGDLVSR